MFFCLHSDCLAVAADSSPNLEDQEVPQLKEYVVSDTQLPSVGKPILSVPSKVTLITAEDIQKSGAKTTQEAIQSATGIIFYNQNGNNFQQNIGLRGFSADPVPAISVFVDGMRVNEPGFNTINWDLIPFEIIEKIEILPGPTALFGKNALAGVVQITTKKGSQIRQATGDTLWGSFQRERYTVNTSGPVNEKTDYYFNFSRETENGFRDESNARISRFFGKIGFHPTAKTDIDVSYTYVKDRLLQAGTLNEAQAAANRNQNVSPGDFSQSEQNMLRVNGQQKLPLGLSLSGNIFYRHLNQNNFTNSGGGFTVNSLNKTEMRGGVLQITHEGKFFQQKNILVLGGEVTRNDFSRRGVAFGASNNTATGEDIVGLYVQDTLDLFTKVSVTGGLRYDHDQYSYMDKLSPALDQSKRFSRITPRAGINYRVRPGTSIYFSYSEGFRIPTPDEVFATIGFSNPNLRPVRSQSYEIGVKTALGSSASMALAFYQTLSREEIFFTCTICLSSDPGFDGLNRNIDKARRRGVEATFEGRYGGYVDGVLNYTYTESQFRSPFNISTSEVIEVGDSFPLVPKHRISVTGNIHPTKNWTLSISGLYVSTQFLLSDSGNSQPRLPGYFVLNGRLAYERLVPGGVLKGFVMVNNILDNEYFDYGIFSSFSGTRNYNPAAPIAFFGGLSYLFDAFPE